MQDNSYKIASLEHLDEEIIKKAEQLVKEETGKDLVIIAWEKKIN